MKLALGTAQFGLSYGISNTRGQTPEAEARAIIDAATREGLDVVDTAPAYGDSESVLGRILPDRRVRVVTKTPHFASEEITANDVLVLERSLESSLRNLGCDAVYGLLVHGARDVLKPGGERLVSALTPARQGRVLKVGVSAIPARRLMLSSICSRRLDLRLSTPSTSA